MEVLGSHPAAEIRMYCLKHLAAAAGVPPRRLTDLAAFVRAMRLMGDCETRPRGFCDAKGHDTNTLLVWRSRSL